MEQYNALLNYGVLGVVLLAVGMFFWFGLWPFAKSQVERLVGQVSALSDAMLKQSDAYVAATSAQRDAHIAVQGRFLDVLQRMEIDAVKQNSEQNEIMRNLVKKVDGINVKIDRLLLQHEVWSGMERRRRAGKPQEPKP